MNFASDNAAGVHPKIMEAVAAEAAGSAPGYGNDPLTQSVEARIREIFEAPDAQVYLVATGTAANALSLACLCPPWSAIYAHTVSHVEEDEAGAPEFFTGGAKLTLVGGEHGKVDPDALAKRLENAAPRGIHNVQKGALSITQITEIGALYSLDEIRRLTAIAHDAGIPVHMDGARFANAVAALGCSPAEASWKAGVDVLCLGATKNGALAAEAVILFDPESADRGRAFEFELRRKRGGHLISKMRYVAAQMGVYLIDGLWLDMAAHANAMAARLATGLRGVEGATLTGPAEGNVQGNMIFADLRMDLHRRLAAAGARYYPSVKPPPDESPDTALYPARLVCSFQTTEDEVDHFIEIAGDSGA